MSVNTCLPIYFDTVSPPPSRSALAAASTFLTISISSKTSSKADVVTDATGGVVAGAVPPDAIFFCNRAVCARSRRSRLTSFRCSSESSFFIRLRVGSAVSVSATASFSSGRFLPLPADVSPLDFFEWLLPFLCRRFVFFFCYFRCCCFHCCRCCCCSCDDGGVCSSGDVSSFAASSLPRDPSLGNAFHPNSGRPVPNASAGIEYPSDRTTRPPPRDQMAPHVQGVSPQTCARPPISSALQS